MTPSPRPVDRLLRGVGAAVFVAATLVNVFCLASTWHPMPLLDSWESIADYQEYLAHGLDWTQIFALHNEHRIAPSKLLTLLDYRFFAGTGLLLVATNVVLSILSADILCVHSGVDSADAPPVLRLLFAAAIGTSVAQIANLVWAFQTSWYFALFLSMLAFRAYQRGAHVGSPVRSGTWTVAAWTLGVAATFSNANGQLVWPVLLVIGFAMRRRWRVQLASAALGACVIALYFHGYRAPPQHPPLTRALHEPLDLARFVAVYATNAIQIVGVRAQVIIGAVLVLGSLVWTLRSVAQRVDAATGRVFAGAVLLFLLATASITAVGRLGLGGHEYADSSRYVSYGLFLLVAAALLLAAHVPHAVLRRRVLLGSWTALVVVATWTGLAGAPYAEARYMRQVLLDASACDAVRACPDDVLFRVYPDAPRARERLSFLRAYRLAPYAPHVARRVPERALLPLPHVRDLAACEGRIDAVDAMRDGTRQLRGWMIWPGERRRLPDAIGVYTLDGARLGGGGLAESRVDVQRQLRLRFASAIRLYGFHAWARDLPEQFYAVGFFGGDACKLTFPAPPRT